MKKNIFAILLITGFAILAGCSKDDGVGCFKSTGPIRQEERSLGPYHYIEVHDNINLFLIQDSVKNEVVVEAGENLLPRINTVNQEGRLVMTNDNQCNWLRDFSIPINIYLTFSDLDTIIYRAAGDLTCMNTWVRDSVQFEVWEGAGVIRLDLMTEKTRLFVHYGTVSVEATGYSQVTFLLNQGYGPVNTLDLFSKFTYLSTRSPNDCYVFATEDLEAEIINKGDVYYKGDPKNISSIITGEGRLIRLP